MKKVLFTVALVALMASPAFAFISGSLHDFSAQSWTTNNRICVPCHTPHNADLTVATAPLWNHTVTTKSYAQYDSATLNAYTAATVAPSGISALCLSCHDGSVALDAFGVTPGNSTFMTGTAAIGADADGMKNDHPISFTYNDALATADGGLFPPTSTTSGLGLNIDDDMLFGAGKDQVECASCHDVHRKNETVAFDPMLRISNYSSALCLTCHNK